MQPFTTRGSLCAAIKSMRGAGLAKKRGQGTSGEAEARTGLRQILGDLEAEIMECVWDLGSASVKDVHSCLLERREIAYTTVMTVMSRLATKGFLRSRREGRAFVYEAATGREDFCAGVVRDFMAEMLSDADRSVLAQFVDSVTEHDKTQLDLLAQIIEEKRREATSSQ
jgi:predicted transcriptional regulator